MPDNYRHRGCIKLNSGLLQPSHKDLEVRLRRGAKRGTGDHPDLGHCPFPGSHDVATKP